MTDHDPNEAQSKRPGTAFEGAKPGAFAANVAADNSSPAFASWGVSPAQSAALARNWWALLLRGIFTFLFGIIAILMPGATLAALVLLFAVYMLVDGVFAIIAAVRAASQHERFGLMLFEGIADLAAAAVAFLWPLTTLLAFVLLLAAWAVVSGALLLAGTFKLNAAHGRWLMALGGIVSIVWGVLLIWAPFVGAVVLTWWLGGYALFFGGALIVLAFQLRRHARTAQLARAG
jgi:uncharacterized membrane protein HdeD (DUF308 family)